MNYQDHDNEIAGDLIGTGTWLDWLPKLPRPIFPFGKKDLYSVLLKGHDFVLPIEGSKSPAIGFYTTRFVAAENFPDAENASYNSVIKEWRDRGYHKICGKDLILSTEEIVIQNERFRLRSGAGFTFYGSEDSK